MKLKKLTLMAIITFVAMLATSIFSAVYAATGSMYLGITMLRSENGYGYQALGKNVWKIVEVNSAGESADYNKTIYCLKGGPGFGSDIFGSGTPRHREYTRYFDMKDPSSIPAEYAKALPDTSSDTYKSLVWLLEHVYVRPKTNASEDEKKTAQEYKELLLANAGLTTDYLTDDDIDAVQQLAVWHFTNNDEYKVENTSPEGTFEFAINAIAGSDSNYNPMSDEINENGLERAEDCQTLYTYLVQEAEKNSNYTVTPAKAPYEVAKLTQTMKTVGSNYVIGPFKINKLSDTSATLTATFKNGDTEIHPTLQDASGKPIASIEETIGKEFYIVLPTTTNIEKITFSISGSYFNTSIQYWAVENAPENEQPVALIERVKTPYSSSTEFIPNDKPFDLALRKFIISINGEAPEVNREPQIDSDTLEDLRNGTTTTAEKVHPKNALVVKTGDKVIYKIRVYNEGKQDAYVKEITDYLPEGLEFIPTTESTINSNNGWKLEADGKTVTTDKLSGTLLKAFDGTNLQYLDVEIECKVVATVQNNDTLLKNIAEITEATDGEGNPATDRDSTPDNVDKDNYGTTNQEDDDDFEQLVILGQYFDLSLRKFITAVNDEELVDDNGKYIREPQVDVTPLLNGSATSSQETTAIYNHSKIPVGVAVGDEVVYTLRIYNEGQISGYANEVVDHLPPYLEFVNDEFNASYGWTISGDGRTVTTTITSPDTEYSASRDTIYAERKQGNDKVIIDAFDGKTLDYIDIKIKCKVKDTGLAEKITNIAEITEATDGEGNPATDRDSTPDNVTLPSDEKLPGYKDDEINSGDEYIPGQEDDDDFEKVIVQKFDLALRKFITAVNDTEITNRVPVFSMTSDKEFTYTHPKDPVEVANNDIVTYTLRIYNEGNQAGYAEEVKDDLPEGLEYLPNNDLNKEYRWKMYKADGTETNNVAEATTIKTDYLSKAQEEETGRNNLIKAFDTDTMTQPDYKEVKIAFKVTEPNTSDRILINTAEISDDADENGDEVEDIDSTPNNDKDGEDDIDIEKVKVKYFDLALKKIISETIVTVDGKTTTTKTGHTFEQEPEPVVKVELNSNKVKNATIKFKFKIRVTNEGEIEGYVKEIKDYIPEGLKFVASDNEGWKLSSDGKTVTTDQLKDTLLKPGESATVEIVFRWINGQDNLGLKTNVAEISKDYNDHGSPDIDSTPDNQKEGEDDIDDASVILSVQTGGPVTYVAITGSVLAILAGGIVLIKRFVI